MTRVKIKCDKGGIDALDIFSHIKKNNKREIGEGLTNSERRKEELIQ